MYSSNDDYFTNENGYILVGKTYSNDGNISGNHSNNGNSDIWVAKTSNIGNIEWQKCLGSTGNEWGFDIIQTLDGGYIISGATDTANGDVSLNHGSNDAWIIKLSNFGMLQWQKTFGGSSGDDCESILQNTDGSYLLTANTLSNDGDVSLNHGSNDAWMVKLTPENLEVNDFQASIKTQIFPNPTNDFINISTKEKISSAEIIDMKGRNILKTNKVEDKISVENLPKGMYLLKIQLENGETVTEKIIKN